MNVIKVVAGFACVFLIVLSTLLVFIENPEKKLYKETIETLMIQEDLSSSQEVVDSIPELKNIKSKMERIAYLTNCIHNMTVGPNSNLSKEESFHVKEFAQEVRQLRKNVKEELSQLVAIHAEDRP